MRSSTRVKSVAFLLAVFCLAAVAGFLVGGDALALPPNEVETTYFSDGTYSQQVGYKILFCSGARYQEGTTTIYKQVYSTPC
jgi:hypothetical protein